MIKRIAVYTLTLLTISVFSFAADENKENSKKDEGKTEYTNSPPKPQPGPKTIESYYIRRVKVEKPSTENSED